MTVPRMLARLGTGHPPTSSCTFVRSMKDDEIVNTLGRAGERSMMLIGTFSRRPLPCRWLSPKIIRARRPLPTTSLRVSSAKCRPFAKSKGRTSSARLIRLQSIGASPNSTRIRCSEDRVLLTARFAVHESIHQVLISRIPELDHDVVYRCREPWVANQRETEGMPGRRSPLPATGRASQQATLRGAGGHPGAGGS